MVTSRLAASVIVAALSLLASACTSPPGGCPRECFRAIQCRASCGSPIVQSGCCPCPAGTIDDIVCGADGGDAGTGDVGTTDGNAGDSAPIDSAPIDGASGDVAQGDAPPGDGAGSDGASGGTCQLPGGGVCARGAACPAGDGCNTCTCVAGSSTASCTDRACPPGDAGLPFCNVDMDCRLFSNDCGMCSCDALRAGQPAPRCSGTRVQCLEDPCAGRSVACAPGSGQCRVR